MMVTSIPHTRLARAFSLAAVIALLAMLLPAATGGALTSKTLAAGPNTPTVTTTLVPATSPVAIGASAYDTATIVGGYNPTGTISYGVYSNSTCTILVADLTPASNAVTGGVAPDSKSYTFTSAGTYYFMATYSGDANNTGPVSSACTSETVVVNPASPTIATVASPATGTVGVAITNLGDTATFSGAYNPTGSVSFALYSNNTCTAATGVSGSGTISSGVASYSQSWTPTAAGTYYWKVSYVGDTNNNPYSACGGTNETVVVSPASLGTTPSAGGPIGTVLNDSATLTGGNSPTGSITFNLYGPGASCTGTPLYTQTVALPASSPYTVATTPGFTPVAPGTYEWTASYAGDANNSSASSGCGAEAVVVSKYGPSLGTTPSAGGPIGTVLNDSATLTGGNSPTGSITFKLYGPNDLTCSNGAIYTQTVTPLSAGSATTSPGFPTTAAGTYEWTASYAGDANNSSASSGCTAEAVVVSPAGPASPSVTTTLVPATSPVSIGASVYDTATIVGGYNPTGTIYYGLYSDSSCTTLVANLTPATNVVTGGVAPNSNSYTFTSVGTFYFQAAYSGDANNTGPVSSPCTSETVVVNPASGSFYFSAATEWANPGISVHAGDVLTFTASGTYGVAGSDPGKTPAGVGCFAQSNPTFAAPNLSLWGVIGRIGTGTAFCIGAGSQVTATASGELYFSINDDVFGDNWGGVTVNWQIAAGPNTPTVTTTLVPATSPVSIGASVYDTATIVGGYNPTGTISYGVYSNSTCTILVADLTPASNAVTGGVAPDSKSYTFTSVGTFYFQAAYSGDANNTGPVSSPCTSETVVVNPNQTGGTPVGTNVPVTPATTGGTSPVNLTFGTVAVAGTTSLTESPTAPAPLPVGYQLGSPAIYYDLETTASYSGTITVCISYAGITPAPTSLLHYQNGAWQDITTSVNTTSQTICGATTSLSPFALVTKKLTITASSGTMTYGGKVPTITPTYSGFVNGDTVASLTTKPTCTASATASSPVGTYLTTCSGAVDPNYTITYVAGTLSVAPAPLTVTAPSPSRAYGAANPTFTPTYSGFVAGDTTSSLTTQPTCSTTATATSGAGTYPVACSGAVDPNYTIGYVAGTLSVVIVDRYWTPAGVTLKVAAPGFLALTNVGTSSVVVSSAPKGKLTLGSASGSFTYVPPSGWTGADSFNYELKTGTTLSSPVTVTIFVLGSGVNCTGCNLSGLLPGALSLTGANLSKANLTGIGLGGANLGGSNLSGANLAGANLASATLTGVNLSNATMTGAILPSANLTGSNLSGATLIGANLTGATLTGANLSNANLSSASLSSANLTGANLSGANLTNALAVHANLTGANLAKAILTGADLTQATLTGVAWGGATCPDGTGANSHGNTCVGHLNH